jgi:NADPH:quinone reductase-like Zn-dependent oxidoreductase
MKAVFFEKHGGNEVLQVGDRPDPRPGPGEALVRIRAAALNHLDLFVRDGLPNVPIALPHIPGSDGSGIVESLGPGVEGLRAGDRVLIQPGLYCNACEFCRAGEQSLCVKYKLLGEHVPGTFAESIAIPARNLFAIPDAMSFPDAAAFPLAYQTAWRMIVGRARLQAGETVLIHGIGGGVAWACLEIARLSGARVFVTSSDDAKLAAAREAGAEEAWNYRGEDIRKAVSSATRKRGCDVVVDTVGESTWMISLRSVARGGRIVTCGATSGPNPEEEIRLIFWNQIAILGSTMASDREFRSLLSAVFSGRLHPLVDSVFPIEAIRSAYERMEGGSHRGKIVITL